MNIENYDLILGTPFLHQHKIALAFNPSKLSVGSGKSLPIEGENVAIIPDSLISEARGRVSQPKMFRHTTPVPPRFPDVTSAFSRTGLHETAMPVCSSSLL